MSNNLKKIAKQAAHYDHVLLVMRHAKAESSNAAGDHERNLTDKGVKQAKRVSRGLSRMGLIPDRIVCSSALRAQQTLERMLTYFGDKPKVDYRHSLYDSGVQAVFDEVEQTKDKHRVVLVLGHEPTVSISCQWLAASESDPAVLDSLNLGMSAASVAIFGSNEPLSAWKVHSGDLIAVVNPKDFE